MTALPAKKIAFADVASNRKRGGDVRAMLTSKTVGATSGFMGVAVLEPGEFVSEHYHPYSEEFIYVVSGLLVMRIDDEPVHLAPGEGLVVPKNARHRLMNVGDERAEVVFHLGPLAPRPDLGHVDTEPYPAEVANAGGTPA
ncbi:cupin domain-containing protein [Paractinoplanes ferrugineus]|uniref:Cupin n=1 Tax=Paractinoplanes ferrugineus TaxID=113564 RepID=A0A919JAG7_9ACTN|nr:cupin domain-containing protein [Actinoplanes ferrugineus]GIE16252.1 cupin [Actinoplanes ferrugineus]